MRHRAFILAVCVAFVGAHVLGDEPRPAKLAPKRVATTPPPKKKRAELEADEEPAQIPMIEREPNKQESYNVTMPLVGIWEAAGKRLLIKDGGAYTLMGAERDEGFVQASLGLLWRKSNGTKRWVEGRYKFRSIEVVEIEAAFGPGEWRRVK